MREIKNRGDVRVTLTVSKIVNIHDDVIKWKHFPRY